MTIKMTEQDGTVDHGPEINQRIAEVKAIRKKAGLMREIRDYLGRTFFQTGYSGDPKDMLKKVDEPIAFTKDANVITLVATYSDFEIAIKGDREEENKILKGIRQTGYFKITIASLFDDDPLGHRYTVRYLSERERKDQLKQKREEIQVRMLRWKVKNSLEKRETEHGQ